MDAGLRDAHPYVREAAVMGVLKCFHQDPAGALGHAGHALVLSLHAVFAVPRVLLLHKPRASSVSGNFCTRLPASQAPISRSGPLLDLVSCAVPTGCRIACLAAQYCAGVRMRGLLERVDTLLSSDSDPQVRACQCVLLPACTAALAAGSCCSHRLPRHAGGSQPQPYH